jgi:hypothetical protein
LDSLKPLDLDEQMQRAMLHLFNTYDRVTNGAFRRGYRVMNAAERIAEWDALPPEQKDQLRQTQGDEWFFGQAGEIEKLRRETAI